MSDSNSRPETIDARFGYFGKTSLPCLLFPRRWTTLRLFWSRCRRRATRIAGLLAQQLRPRKEPRPDDELGRNILVGLAVDGYRPAIRIPARGAAGALSNRRLKPFLDRSSADPDPVRLKRILRERLDVNGCLLEDNLHAQFLQGAREISECFVYGGSRRAAPIARPPLFVHKTLPTNLEYLHFIPSHRALSRHGATGQQYKGNQESEIFVSPCFSFPGSKQAFRWVEILLVRTLTAGR